jgi:hypothetical protein
MLFAVLTELIQEVPLTAVAAKYGLEGGKAAGLQQECESFCGRLAAFCREAGFHHVVCFLLLACYVTMFHFSLLFRNFRRLC